MTDIPPDYCKCYVNILHHTFETFMPLPSYFWDFDAPIRHTFGTLVPLHRTLRTLMPLPLC